MYGAWFSDAAIKEAHDCQAAAMDWPRIRAEAEEAFTLAGIPFLIKSELAKV